MDELEKQISGKWIDVKENARDIFTIDNYFRFSESILKTEVEKLSSAVELGIIEYKRNIINSVFRQLGNIQYKSLSQDMIKELENMVLILLFVILLQRLIAAGTVKIDREKTDDRISADNIEITLILKDILARVKDNPEFTKKPAVKNILLQFTIYKNEKETLKKLSSSNREKVDAFYRNFKGVFEKIFASIRKNYTEILKEDAAQFTRSHVLVDVQDKKLVLIILNQAREVSRIAAILGFTYQEKYKTREILVNLYNSEKIISGYVEQELKYYSEFVKASQQKEKNISVICINFTREIANLINKYCLD